MPKADPARLVALDVLRAVEERDAYANLELSRLLREQRLTGRDAALATELVSGTLTFVKPDAGGTLVRVHVPLEDAEGDGR